MKKDKATRKGPPEFNPYVFTVLLFLFGAWCCYDGWISSDPEMQDHRLVNQVIGAVLLPWSVFDYFKVKKTMRKKSEKEGGDG